MYLLGEVVQGLEAVNLVVDEDRLTPDRRRTRVRHDNTAAVSACVDTTPRDKARNGDKLVRQPHTRSPGHHRRCARKSVPNPTPLHSEGPAHPPRLTHPRMYTQVLRFVITQSTMKKQNVPHTIGLTCRGRRARRGTPAVRGPATIGACRVRG